MAGKVDRCGWAGRQCGCVSRQVFSWYAGIRVTGTYFFCHTWVLAQRVSSRVEKASCSPQPLVSQHLARPQAPAGRWEGCGSRASFPFTGWSGGSERPRPPRASSAHPQAALALALLTCSGLLSTHTSLHTTALLRGSLMPPDIPVPLPNSAASPSLCPSYEATVP